MALRRAKFYGRGEKEAEAIKLPSCVLLDEIAEQKRELELSKQKQRNALKHAKPMPEGGLSDDESDREEEVVAVRGRG